MGSHGQSEGVVDMPPGVDEEQQQARQALWDAAAQGDVPAMQRLLDVEPGGGQSSSAVESMQRAMLEAADGLGRTGLLQAAWGGYGDAIRLLLNHPFADPAAMMMHTTKLGGNALTLAAYNGHVDAMRVLLDHPSADPAAMMMRATSNGATALTLAAYNGHVDAMRVLLYHLSPEAAVVMPSDAQQARMSMVMEALCEGPRSNEMFDQDQPDDVRDDCVCLLLERGAHVLRADSPVVSRIVREHALLARVPQLINEAVVGMAVMQLQQNPQDNA
ncbi:hypothetical protein FOA52_011449 [Chlamydomonas sp. UWO 241]|nr:hypothetical protein FOA52_011449 [Chlamydomonas sp. UWO 241]